MTRSHCSGCSEYNQLSRREFLGASGLTVAALSAPAWLPRVAYAGAGGPRSDRDLIISVFLRGGADGLTLCVPHGDDNYYAVRPTISIPRPDSGDPAAAIDLDGFFGLPKGLERLIEAYQAGDLLIVHGTGSVDDSRSHFDAMHYMEVGKARDASLATGWLGRHLASTDPLDRKAVLRAVGIASGLQRTLVGSPLALPIPNLADFNIGGDYYTLPDRTQALNRLHAAGSEPLRTAGKNTIRTISLLEKINFYGYVPSGGAVYPESYFGYSLKSSAALIKAEVGVEAIAVDLHGWDTHAEQQPRDGYMHYLMHDLGDALAALYTDVIGGGYTNVTVVVMSEFGRVVAENGSKGCDHGHGNVMFALGTGIDGGRVLAEWPGLSYDQLFQGQDLQVTIDHRSILAEIVKNRLGNDQLDTIFPGFTPTFYGITK